MTDFIDEIGSLFPSGTGQISAVSLRKAFTDLSGTLGIAPAANADVGVLVIGDSIMVSGHSKIDYEDYVVPNGRIKQYPQTSWTGGVPANTIGDASEPLSYPDARQSGPPILVGPPIAWCRQALALFGAYNRLVILPQAIVGSGLSNTFTTIGGLGQNQGFAPPSMTAQADIACVSLANASAGSINDTVKINGVTLTSIAGVNSGTNFQYSATAQTYAENLRACINTNTGSLGVHAPNPSVGAIFTVIANASGSAGNVQCDGTKVGSFFSFYFNAPTTLEGYATAASGARLVGGSDGAGGTHYANAISQSNGFINLNSSVNRIGAILCGIGTNDTRMSASQFKTWLLGMIDGLRAGITGGANIPFLAFPGVPEYWIGGGAGSLLTGKWAVLQNIANFRANCAFVQPIYGNSDPVPYHPDGNICRYVGGVSGIDAFRKAVRSEAVAPFPNSSFATNGPTIETNLNHTVSAMEYSIVFTNVGGCIVTLPDPAVYPGRWLLMNGSNIGIVSSDQSNVTPLAGGSAGATILGAASGKWALLQSDGVSTWRIMAAN